MMKRFKCLLLVMIANFMNVSAQSDALFQDQLSFEEIVRIDQELEYTYPMDLRNAVYKNEFILIERVASSIKNDVLRFKGLVSNFTTNETQHFDIRIDQAILKNYDNISNCSFTESYLLLNFIDRQLIFSRVENTFSLTSVLDYKNITGNVYIEDSKVFLSCVGKFHKREKQEHNLIIEYNFKKNKEVGTQIIKLKGEAFNSMHPTKFVDFNPSFIIWIEPLDHRLFIKDRKRKTIDTLDFEIDDWVLVSEEEINKINQFNDMSDMLMPLRKLNFEISRVWTIKFIDETTLLTIYHNPDKATEGMNFFINVFKYSNKTWVLEHESMSLTPWHKLTSEDPIEASKFPFLFSYMGSTTLFSKGYSCILIDENDVEFGSLKYKDLTSDERSPSYGLKLHKFKNEFD